MEQRCCKILICKAGGNASASAEAFKLPIPTTWARRMGFSRDTRDAIISFVDGKIIIEKKMEGQDQ